MFKINYLRLEKEKSEQGINRQGNKKDLDKIIKSLAYELTSDQQKVLNEIIEDLDSDKRMNRIIDNKKFNLYYDFLVQENEKYNLTSITDKDEAYIKHFYE